MYFFLFIAVFVAVCNADEDLPVNDKVGICTIRNGYFKVDGSCDAYVECRDYQPTRLICPDGLNYNPRALWPNYPCGYPADVPCIGRGNSQPANPTADCPHQYGFFKSPVADENDCGQYRLCAEGIAYDMFCPFGLAFDVTTARCDWPELVPGCNTEGFLGFTCPEPQYDGSGNPIVSNYSVQGDCYLFYSCESGRARMLSCDEGLAFDKKLGRCIDANLVNCGYDLSSGADEESNGDA